MRNHPPHADSQDYTNGAKNSDLLWQQSPENAARKETRKEESPPVVVETAFLAQHVEEHRDMIEHDEEPADANDSAREDAYSTQQHQLTAAYSPSPLGVENALPAQHDEKLSGESEDKIVRKSTTPETTSSSGESDAEADGMSVRFF